VLHQSACVGRISEAGDGDAHEVRVSEVFGTIPKSAAHYLGDEVDARGGMVAEIAERARARGIDVIVDAAHGFGQIDYAVPDLKADFVGINLHKWIGAPVGVGAMYVRKGRVADLDPYMGETDDGRVGSRVHTGTVNFAAYLALPEAIALHQRIGAANKQARLRYLRERWTVAARQMAHIEVLSSPDPALASALASFRLRGHAT
jgi:selenocysteine lyase/cysteine desulfurase